jgi:DNA-binding protein HU-beta
VRADTQKNVTIQGVRGISSNKLQQSKRKIMNKGDLIQFVKDKTALSKTDSEKAVNAVFEGIASALQKKEEATFVGFGSFAVVKRKAREGRNPKDR